MSFIKKLFRKEKSYSPSNSSSADGKPSMIVMESDTLGMTVVEESGDGNDEIV